MRHERPFMALMKMFQENGSRWHICFMRSVTLLALSPLCRLGAWRPPIELEGGIAQYVSKKSCGFNLSYQIKWGDRACGGMSCDDFIH
jgi:hypothetical protein